MRRFWFCLYLLTVVAFVFAAAEGVLRLTGHVPDSAFVARYFLGVHGDLEPHMRLIDRMNPELPYRVSANNQGSRGLRDYTSAKPEGVLRVLCLGDSFTFGFGVDDEFTYPELLHQELTRRYPGRKFEVINAGIPLFGILDAMDYFLTKGAALQPDVVVLQFFPNDIHDHTRDTLFREGLSNDPVYTHRGLLSRWFAWSRLYQAAANLRFGDRKGQAAVSAPAQKTSGENILNRGLDPYRFQASEAEISLSRNREVILGKNSGSDLERVWASYVSALDGMRRMCAHFGAGMLFVMVPEYQEVKSRLYACHQLLAPPVNAMALPAVDLLEPFRRSLYLEGVQPFLMPRDGHCSPHGNQLVAGAVADRLRVLAGPDGREALVVAKGPPLASLADPQEVQLAVGLPGLVAALGGKGLYARVQSATGLAVGSEQSVAIDTIQAQEPRGAAGELVIAFEADRDVSRVEIRLPAMLARDEAKLSTLGVDISLDQRAWETLLDKSEDDDHAMGGFETYAMLDHSIRDVQTRHFWIRIRLTGKSRLYTERPGQGDGSRAFWVTAFPATR